MADTEVKHTPGPWFIEDPFGDYLSVAIGGPEAYDWRFVAHVHTDLEKGPKVRPIGKTQMEANAHLIAAAPDMLAALKGAEEWLKGFASAEPYLGVIQEAIAKAEGSAS